MIWLDFIKMNKDIHNKDDQPLIASALSDFLKAAAPKAGHGPLDEMTELFRYKREDEAAQSRTADATFFFTGSNHFEWMVEAQIRQWNMTQKAQKDAQNAKNKPPAPGK